MEKKEEYLSKVETKEGSFYLFVQKIGHDSDEIDLHVTDGCGMWSKKVDSDLLKEMASKVEMDTKDYTSGTLAALTCQHSANNCFVYQVIKNDAKLEFSWKKVLDDGVKYQLGSISLPSKDENKALMQRILNFSISKIQDFKDNISSMKTEIEQLSTDRSNALLRLEKCVTSKEEMELDLFQKFVAVLNEKKAKIRRLQEAMEKQSKEEISKNTDLSLSNNDRGNNLNTNRDDDTDEESHLPQGNEKQKADMSSNISSCLFNDEEDTAPVVKRRRRNQTTKANTTPSKPVLPEVKAPVKRTISNASTDSAASNESKQSSKGARRSWRKKKEPSTFPDDVEDLFGDME